MTKQESGVDDANDAGDDAAVDTATSTNNASRDDVARFHNVAATRSKFCRIPNGSSYNAQLLTVKGGC